ncbi:uncharacterized protein V1518DRAFT_410091 [Limtongia smithiae]|uniref:uncharacterized protein n=1 Tax=Limtongia smithiae TaxID=1125753 RepID=UPI0034CDE8AD
MAAPLRPRGTISTAATAAVRMITTHAPSPKKQQFIDDAATFSGALERLRRKTVKKPLALTREATQTSQEALLRSSLGKKASDADMARLHAIKQKDNMYISPQKPSAWLFSKLIAGMEGEADLQELKTELARLHNRRLYSMPDWQTANLFRALVMKGLYKEATFLVAQPTSVYGLTVGTNTHRELLRTEAIYSAVSEHTLNKVNKIDNLLIRISGGAKHLNALFDSDIVLAGLALNALEALRANDHEPHPAAFKIYTEVANKYSSALRTRWTAFPAKLPADTNLSTAVCADLQRNLIDYTLTLEGLQRSLTGLTDKTSLAFNTRVAAELERTISDINSLLSAKAAEVGKTAFSLLTIDSYKAGLRLAMEASATPVAEAVEA